MWLCIIAVCCLSVWRLSPVAWWSLRVVVRCVLLLAVVCAVCCYVVSSIVVYSVDGCWLCVGCCPFGVVCSSLLGLR